MDYLFGLKTKDFVVLAADRSRLQSIYVLSDEASKCWRLGDSIAMGCVGEGGDAEQFAEYLDKNMQLYRFRNGLKFFFAKKFLNFSKFFSFAFRLRIESKSRGGFCAANFGRIDP